MNPTDTPEAAKMPCLICLVTEGVFTPIAMLGAFKPTSEEARTAVLTLRRRPVVPGHDPGLAYGLCTAHKSTPVEQVEATIIAAAKGTIQ